MPIFHKTLLGFSSMIFTASDVVVGVSRYTTEQSTLRGVESVLEGGGVSGGGIEGGGVDGGGPEGEGGHDGVAFGSCGLVGGGGIGGDGLGGGGEIARPTRQAPKKRKTCADTPIGAGGGGVSASGGAGGGDATNTNQLTGEKLHAFNAACSKCDIDQTVRTTCVNHQANFARIYSEMTWTVKVTKTEVRLHYPWWRPST